MRETWYVLENDSVVPPSEVTDENGVLTHKDGRVAMRGDVPSSRGVEIDVETGLRAFDGPHDHLDTNFSAQTEHENQPGDLGRKSVKELLALAAEKGVDLGEATKKADIVAALEKALEPDIASGGYKTREMKAE